MAQSTAAGTAIHHHESFATQFESVSGLTRWTGWLVVMAGVVVAFGLAIASGGGRAAELGMYGVIVALGIGVTVKGYGDARFLDRETRLASDQVRILEEVDDIPAFLARAPRSVFRSHIENLHTISLSRADVSQDNLIEILHSRLIARNREVELCASILITLGLIGTIIGLILMMDGMGSALATGGDSLLARIADPDTGPLRGLATAFNTTLLGAVLGGVVLRVLASVVDANTMRYTAHLAELTEVHVLPHLRATAAGREREARRAGRE